MKKLVVLGLGQRGDIYAAYAKKYPEKFQLVAIIENNPARFEYAAREYPDVRLFTDYQSFLDAKVAADIVAVATQDANHK